jgi:predicted phage-related endonuclease
MMSAEEKAAWLAARAGKLTASRMADAMNFLKNGQPSRERVKLMHELLAERLTGQSVSHVVTDAMLFGMEHEDEAVDVFVERTGRDVRRSRFYEHPTIENFGATPDREIDDGLLEVKVPTSTTFIGWTLGGCVPEQHKPQMCAQLLCSNKSWCGFLAYDPCIREERRQLFMRKYEPTGQELAAVQDAAIQFLTELDNLFDQFVTAAA